MKSQEELAAEWEASLLAEENASANKEQAPAIPASEPVAETLAQDAISQLMESKPASIESEVVVASEQPPLRPATSAPLGSAVSAVPRASGGREVTVSSLLHLMGVPTNASIELLEKKVDILSSKLAAITVKIDRLVAQVSKSTSESYLDRIDSQLSELRNILKSGKAPGKGVEGAVYSSAVGSAAGDGDDGETGEHELSLSSVPGESSKKENS